MEAKDLKFAVKEKYGEIAVKSLENSSCGCGCSCGSGSSFPEIGYKIMGSEYESKDGYVESADLGLGCGLPIDFAELKRGESVLDLGSGAGNDVFIARKAVGDAGFVTGLDMTEEMVFLARRNAAKFGFENVSFVDGEIEAMPFEDAKFDAILSNCVLNLVPDKNKAFREMYRVLRRGGRFSISDIVIQGELDPKIKESAEMYVGCIAGAIAKEDYISELQSAGFEDVEIKSSKSVILPESFIKSVSDTAVIADNTILSVTVTGRKSR